MIGNLESRSGGLVPQGAVGLAQPAALATDSFAGRSVSTQALVAGHVPEPAPLPQPAGPTTPRPWPPWFELRIPSPKDDIGPRLSPDPWLKSCLQDPVRGRTFYDEQVALRLEKRQTGDEYRFEPFLVTLDNMRRLTAHILADQHFHQELEPDERQAFVRLQGLIDQMIREEAPYKRTVYLAVLMTVILDRVTARHVIEDLRTAEPELWSHYRIEEFFWRVGRDNECQTARQTSAALDLETLWSCRWGGLVPEGCKNERQDLFHLDDYISQCLDAWLDNDRVFFYPSLEALDPEDFCRFGHLPICPLGMMTRYALNADGLMRTPLAFMEHDAFHAWDAGICRRLESPLMLENIDNRLLFRTLALDSLQGIVEPALERAVVLIVFQLLHEKGASEARSLVSPESFLPLLHRISRIRRARYVDYPAEFQKIGDSQALQACLWVHWLYHQLSGDGAIKAGSGPALLARFTQEVWPVFEQHMAFFEARKNSLCEKWVADAEAAGLVRESRDGGLDYGYRSRNSHAFHMLRDSVFFFRQAYDEECEGPVDHTDVAYFEAIVHPDEYQRLARELGDELPPYPVYRL